MRVILSTAYCNPQRSESALEIVEDFETTSPSEHSETDENQPIDTTFVEYPSVQNTRERSHSLEVSTSTPKLELQLVENLDCGNDLERKLPARPQQNERHKSDDKQAVHQSSHRKRSLLHLESKSRNSCDSLYQESKKPAAKMTAGRYKATDREPPPARAYRDENENEPTISVINYQIMDPQQSALNSKPLWEIHQYQNFIKALKERGLEIRLQDGDGNCLFRAVSLQVYGDPNMHMDVRNQCLDHMAKDEEHFAQFVEDEDFSNYIQRKRREGVHGNSPEIQAISELFNRPVEVFTPENGATPLNIFQSDYKTSDVPIRLSYHDNHYDAVVDPLLPTAGLGLGLPGLQPGLADKLQVGKAVQESDELADQAELERVLEESHNDEMQRAIKESTLSVDMMYSETALALSDLEATNLDLEQAVMERSLETFRQHELCRKQGVPKSDVEIPTSLSVARIPSSEVSTSPFAVAAAARLPVEDTPRTSLSDSDEYPPTVQELVMNGFELGKVIRAYELIGDNFDDLLAFLISANT